MKATVYCRMDALRAYDKEKVLISIGSHGYRYEPVAHKDDWFDILVVAFDDVLPETIEKDRRILDVPMQLEHAKQIKSFIEKHIGKDFVIHCDAGISRSTAVASHMGTYYGYDIEYYSTGDSKDKFKNIHVYNLLGRLDYHSAFGDIE